MSTIRRHFLNTGDALDRRRVEELFLEAARRFAAVAPHMIGDAQFTREDFDLATWEEMYAASSVAIRFDVPGHGHIIPDTWLAQDHDDGFFEGELAWSVQVNSGGSTGNLIAAWPVVNGQSVWGGLDFASENALISYVAVTPATPALDPSDQDNIDAPESNSLGSALADFSLSLGNSCVAVGGNGSFTSGIALMSIGSFVITRSNWTLLKVNR